jgi:hypothetical protein
MTRYLSVLFPGFIALGMVGERSRWLLRIVIVTFAIVLACFSLRFAQWHWVA